MSGETILVVDDGQENREFLVKYVLEPNNFQALTAQDGRVGYEMAVKHHPDLILLDLQMPRMNGIDAAKEIRRIAYPNHTPIIAMTAQSMRGDRERCLAAGMDDYIAKPIKKETVLAMVKKWYSEKNE